MPRIRAGASGFLLKDAPPEELAVAVRVIAAGDALLAPSVTRRLIEEFARIQPPREHARHRGAHRARDGGAAGHRARPFERGDRDASS